MLYHLLEPIVGAGGGVYAHNLHLVKLVQAIEPTDILSVGAGLTPETGGVGGDAHWQFTFLQYGIAVDIGEGNLGCGH